MSLHRALFTTHGHPLRLSEHVHVQELDCALLLFPLATSRRASHSIPPITLHAPGTIPVPIYSLPPAFRRSHSLPHSCPRPRSRPFSNANSIHIQSSNQERRTQSLSYYFQTLSLPRTYSLTQPTHPSFSFSFSILDSFTHSYDIFCLLLSSRSVADFVPSFHGA